MMAAGKWEVTYLLFIVSCRVASFLYEPIERLCEESSARTNPASKK
jgi:hypothetical protein